MTSLETRFDRIAADVSAIRTTTDRAAGQWAVVTLIIGPALGAIAASFGAWVTGFLHFRP